MVGYGLRLSRRKHSDWPASPGQAKQGQPERRRRANVLAESAMNGFCNDTSRVVGCLTIKPSSRVMSSCLCKKVEGTSWSLFLPIEIESMEDRVNDSVDTLDINKANHRTRSPSNLNEAAFDDVGGS